MGLTLKMQAYSIFKKKINQCYINRQKTNKKNKGNSHGYIK